MDRNFDAFPTDDNYLRLGDGLPQDWWEKCTFYLWNNLGYRGSYETICIEVIKRYWSLAIVAEADRKRCAWASAALIMGRKKVARLEQAVRMWINYMKENAMTSKNSYLFTQIEEILGKTKVHCIS